MNMRKWTVQIVILALAILVAAVTPAHSAPAKIDPALLIMTQPAANLESARTKGIVKSVEGVTGPVVETILKFDGDLSGVEYYGGRVRSIIGNIATVDIPLSAVNEIALLPNVSYIEAARKLRPRLDKSVLDTKADLLRGGIPPDWTDYTGHNVVVGIVDTGIDIHHKDFKDVSGKTRIRYLFDQTTGKECTSSTIDAGSCTETDTIGHGTHVAGIAAGNGSATGNSRPAYKYIGMAPEADLIIVKTNFLSTGILNGISYIQTKAAALGKPSVVNLSLGGHFGPHDGTSLYEQSLDALSGAGKVIVGAAGNEAIAEIHASGTVAAGGSATVNFNLPCNTSACTSAPDEVLDIWTAGTNTLGISITHNTCTASVVVPDDLEHDLSTTCGDIAIISSFTSANNGDREILVGLFNGAHALAPGAWSFTLTGTNVPVNGRFDVWAGYENAAFNSPDPTITLVDTSTATKTISVASYNTKNSWNSVDGSSHSYSETTFPFTVVVGDISAFSSIGPRRSCSTVANCPTIQKPELAAPGMGIMSSFSANTTPRANSFWIDPDGKHIIDQGTSMATPHVTGAVALLLQKDPTLTSDSIKSILTSNALSDTFTGPIPSDVWGYGKLNAQAASSSLTDYSSSAPSAPIGLAAAATATDTLTLTWTANSEPYLKGYNLYRGTASGAYTTPLNGGTLLSSTATSYKDAGLTNGMTYYYVLKAVSFAGLESTSSNEVSAAATTVTAPGGGGGGGGGGGCFIATAAYGSYLDPHVKTLRAFRDGVLLRSEYGRLFVDLYYTWSPPVAKVIADSPFLRFMARLALTPLVLVLEHPLLVFLFSLVVFLIISMSRVKSRACP